MWAAAIMKTLNKNKLVAHAHTEFPSINGREVTTAIKSALKFAIHRVVDHLCTLFQTRDITISSFRVRDVTIRAQIKIGSINKKRLPDSKYRQKHQNYLLKLEIIKYKCHSDTAM